MISVDGLTVEFGGSALFSDISFVINEKDRIALMGKNGAGKSTLLKILAGVREPTRGKVSAPKDTVIAYLPQHLMTEDGRTVFEETAQAFVHLHEMEAEIAALNKELETRTDYESDSYMELIERVSTLSEKFYSIEEINYDADIEKTLLGLGFTREDFNRQTSEFSGGWRMRIELAKLLLKKPDVLLLDEPTNHLDIESIQWLEDFLIDNGQAVVVISHDRAFVDHITTRTIEVTMGRIYDYKVNYSQYLQLRKERREQQQKAYDEQQKFIAETKDFIERFKGTYSKTLQVQSRVKMLEKLEILEVDEEDTSALRLKFPPSPRSGSYPVTIENVSKSYGDHTVFRNANLTIERGDKIAFVGKNGEGKSTLVKCIMKELEHDGTLTIGHNVMIGYFAQNQASLLDENLTVFQTIDDVAKGDIRNKIKDLLGAFMFGGENSAKKVKVLSGGERTRLAMIKLLLEPVNLLILDEPTNHLDLNSIAWLETYLSNYQGAVLIVSHDRYFLNRVVTKVIEVEQGNIMMFLGNYTAFAQKKKLVREAKLKEYMKQQQEIKHQEAVIEKLRSFNREKSIRRAESREKMLDKMTLVEKPTEVTSEFHISLEPSCVSGNDVLTVQHLSKSFGALKLFQDISFEIKRGEHVAVIGDNGTGKTTLLKILNEVQPADSGVFTLGTNVHIGYYDQEHHVLHMEKTIFDEISDDYPTLTNTQIRNTLAAFLFTGDDVYKQIKDLSGGERGRVSLAKLMLSEANFLILDEPTNHLDITSKEILEKALNDYSGTILYVSHDRYFINQTATRILDLVNHTFVNYIGNYDYYLEKKEELTAAYTNVNTDTLSASAPTESETKLDWKAQKEQQAKERKRQNDLRKTEERISALEERDGEIDELMTQEDVYTNSVKCRELSEEKANIMQELELLYEKWEELAE